MNSARSISTLLEMGCPIRRSSGQRLLPPNRRLSQVTASFIVYSCQGIHRMLFVTSPKIFISHTCIGASICEYVWKNYISMRCIRSSSPKFFYSYKNELLKFLRIMTLQIFKEQNIFCGAKRDRTANLLVANQALSQLSYSPIAYVGQRTLCVGLSRVELLTSRLSGVRSNQLSYRPKSVVKNKCVKSSY